MRSVLLWKDMDQVAEQMDAAVFQYVGELQTESFEAFADFDLLAFDWYDVRKAGKAARCWYTSTGRTCFLLPERGGTAVCAGCGGHADRRRTAE